MLKNKKGAIHVDWAISMGMFLIYVILLFIIIKPGYYSENTPESLFNIVEEQFQNSAGTNIKEIQFIIEKCSQTTVTLTDENNKYFFSKLMSGNDRVEIVNSQAVSISGNSLVISCDNQGGLQNFNTKQTFIAVAHPKDFISVKEFPKFQVVCGVSQEQRCLSYMGVITEFLGLNKEFLNNLKTQDYGNLKLQWGYPLNKEFRIYTNNKEVEIKSNILPNPENLEGIDVYVKEYNGVFLDDKNNRETMKVHIDVW